MKYRFLAIDYKIYYFTCIFAALSGFVLLVIAISRLFLGLYNLSSLIIFVFSLFCVYKFSQYLFRLIKLKRPYIELNLDGVIYSNFWFGVKNIPYKKIQRTEIRESTFNNVTTIDLVIYDWKYAGNHYNGFGEVRELFSIRLHPQHYENLSLDFATWLTILKSLEENERIKFIHCLAKSSPNLEPYLNMQQKECLEKKGILLINNSFDIKDINIDK
jgi:hypothetical protein